MSYSYFEIASVVKFLELLWLLNEVGHKTLTIAGPHSMNLVYKTVCLSVWLLLNEIIKVSCQEIVSWLALIIHKIGLGQKYSLTSGCAEAFGQQPELFNWTEIWKISRRKAWPGLSGCVVLRDAGTWQWTWNGAQLSRELSVNQSTALTLAHPPISQLYNSPHLWHVWQFRTQRKL